MNNQETNSLIADMLGIARPAWVYRAGQTHLELGSEDGKSLGTVALNDEHVANIQSLAGASRAIQIESQLSGHALQLHLVGKKIGQHTWGGHAADYADVKSVARNLEDAVADSDLIVTEVNSLVAIINKDGVIQRFNRVAEEYTGYKEADVIGLDAQTMFMSAQERDASKANVSRFFEQGSPYEVERVINTVKGPRVFEFRNKLTTDGRFLICSGIDVTEERKAKAHLADIANTDVLTGLPNRRRGIETVELAMREAKTSGKVAVLYLDLDDFWRINDRFGHQAGDEGIKLLARRLHRSVQSHGVLARVGGDEFLVVLSTENVARVAEEVAQTIVNELKKPLGLRGESYFVRPSIGIAVSSDEDEGAQGLIAKADRAMYATKKAGKSGSPIRYRFYSDEIVEDRKHEIRLQDGLHRALEDREFSVVYQPVVHVGTGRTVSWEALLRWNHPERGPLGPDEFLDCAERSGLILRISNIVLEEACLALTKMTVPAPISVNLSVVFLATGRVADNVAYHLDKFGIAPALLQVIVPEAAVLEQSQQVLQQLNALKNLGVTIFLDDFGAGHSSLVQLWQLPIHGFKVAHALASKISTDEDAGKLLRAMFSVARELDHSVVVKGVEEKEQADWISKFPEVRAQGFFFGTPVQTPGVIRDVEH